MWGENVWGVEDISHLYILNDTLLCVFFFYVIIHIIINLSL